VHKTVCGPRTPPHAHHIASQLSLVAAAEAHALTRCGAWTPTLLLEMCVCVYAQRLCATREGSARERAATLTPPHSSLWGEPPPDKGCRFVFTGVVAGAPAKGSDACARTSGA
jgi:hypothetical protein